MSPAPDLLDDDDGPVFVECPQCGEHYISNGYDDCPYCPEDQEADE